MFGLAEADVPKGEWSSVELPDKGVKVEHCSCDNAGSFCLVVSDKGVVYFGGTNKKGESGEGTTSVQLSLLALLWLDSLLFKFFEKMEGGAGGGAAPKFQTFQTK